MPASSRPARRALLSTAVAVAVGACMIGGVGVAYAAEPAGTTMVRAAQVTPVASFAPFLSADAADAADAEAPLTTAKDADARAQAQAALDDAGAAQQEVAAAGVTVEGATTIDTTALAEGIARLDAVADNANLLMADPTDQTMADMGTVVAATADLRSRLTAAQEKKAAEEAAAAAAAAAEAAESAQAASTSSRPAASSAPARPIMAGDPRAIGAELAASQYGWGSDQFSCLDRLWQKESGWNPAAHNKGSGAYGIPQALPGSKMATAGSDWETNPATQITWGLGYIAGRYGTPCGAWSHSQSTGWY
ncbi:lytic transglycosylase domain-containing protein [Microbacterium sp. W1N]|uniref:lytic transglycosylase domain-containing protein n=1 Tax=Microbacterium festucae TaxID=2977531 RepID=UPI0021BE9536|nr:lytic transglycosylase domain-containing protein [Microbacterium festucae]MCT9820680.1 lytic transglycosylase domain-containing protein [Microbacterium festucae]